MDISSLAAINNAYVPFSSPTAEAARSLYSESAFEELLKKTQTAQAQSATSLPTSTPFVPSTSMPIDKNSELYEMCMELETFLIKNLIKGMRDTVQKSKLIDTGFAGDMYEDMLYDEYAKTFAKNANLGFAEMAYRDLARYL